jgi:hypothetical protein
MQDVRFILRPSRARLWFALAALAGAGLAFVWIGVVLAEAGPGLRAVAVVAGGLLLWGLARLHDAGGRALVLTDAGLSDTRAGPICAIADIRGVERGVFALKPARGFALRLAAPARRRWVPGLWWRTGRTIGVGGLTGSGETRVLAEMIAAMVAARGDAPVSSSTRSRE